LALDDRSSFFPFLETAAKDNKVSSKVIEGLSFDRASLEPSCFLIRGIALDEPSYSIGLRGIIFLGVNTRVCALVGKVFAMC